MAANIADSLRSNQRKELQRLRRTRSRRIFRLVLAAGLLLFLASLANRYYFPSDHRGQDFELLRRDVVGSGAAWANELSGEQYALQEWLHRRGTSFEQKLFERFSNYIFLSAVNINRRGVEQDPGLFKNFWIGLHFGLLRVVFVILACARLFLVIMIYAAYRGYKSRKVFEGPDLLGQTGNGRLFYSGIRGALQNLTASGAPNQQVRGLACPKEASDVRVKGSPLYQVLRRYDVATGTLTALAGIIIEYDHLPAYIAPQEEEDLLRSFIEPVNLPKNSAALLERILDLHAFYKHHEQDPDFASYLNDFSEEEKSTGAFSLGGYSRYVQKSLHRVLSPAMREMIGGLSADKIAVLFLSLEAGKVMAFAYEGERWLKNSNYPQLCARSVLHSVAVFAEEYNYDERSLIRKALIYASRSSSFGPVKLPVDLSDESRALRQWSEVLMANPYDLENAADEAEMYGILFEAHKKCSQALLDGFMVGNAEMLEGSYATRGNLLLMPFKRIYTMTKNSLSSQKLIRLQELSERLSNKRQLEMEIESELNDKNVASANLKVFSPLSENEISALSSTFKLPAGALREWSALRIVLNNFGWLARRVGDYSVPESSLIFAVLKSDDAGSGVNAAGLIGAPAMVPLRATQLQERWGRNWQSRAAVVQSATMAETEDDYQKLMRGESLHQLEETAPENARIAF